MSKYLTNEDRVCRYVAAVPEFLDTGEEVRGRNSACGVLTHVLILSAPQDVLSWPHSVTAAQEEETKQTAHHHDEAERGGDGGQVFAEV